MKRLLFIITAIMISHFAFGQLNKDLSYWEEKSDTFQRILVGKVKNETILKLYKNNFNVKLKNVKDYNSFYSIFDVILKNKDSYLRPFYFYIVTGLDDPKFYEEAADLSRYFMQYFLIQTEYSVTYMQKHSRNKLFQKFIAFHYYPFDEKDNAGDPSWYNFKNQIAENLKNSPVDVQKFGKEYLLQTDSIMKILRTDESSGKTIDLKNY